MKHKDIKVTFSRLVTPGDIENNIYKENRGNLDDILPNERDGKVYQQFEGVMKSSR